MNELFGAGGLLCLESTDVSTFGRTNNLTLDFCHGLLLSDQLVVVISERLTGWFRCIWTEATLLTRGLHLLKMSSALLQGLCVLRHLVYSVN